MFLQPGGTSTPSRSAQPWRDACVSMLYPARTKIPLHKSFYFLYNFYFTSSFLPPWLKCWLYFLTASSRCSEISWLQPQNKPTHKVLTSHTTRHALCWDRVLTAGDTQNEVSAGGKSGKLSNFYLHQSSTRGRLVWRQHGLRWRGRSKPLMLLCTTKQSSKRDETVDMSKIKQTLQIYNPFHI